MTSCFNSTREARTSFLKDAEFTIGTIDYFTYSNNGNSHVAYSYKVNGIEFKGKDGNCNMDSKEAGSRFYKVKQAEKYLVLYKKEEPENSIIRLDFEIKDSSNFKSYIQKLKKTRKSL